MWLRACCLGCVLVRGCLLSPAIARASVTGFFLRLSLPSPGDIICRHLGGRKKPTLKMSGSRRSWYLGGSIFATTKANHVFFAVWLDRTNPQDVRITPISVSGGLPKSNPQDVRITPINRTNPPDVRITPILVSWGFGTVLKFGSC